MRTPIIWIIKAVVRKIVCKVTGHNYGCCTKIFKPCKCCVYVLRELAAQGVQK